MNPTGRAILDRASAHLRAAGAELVPIDVPEWGPPGEPARVYFRRAISIARLQQDSAIYDDAPDDEGPALELVRNALDAEGAPLFERGDVPMILHELSAPVVGRVLETIRSTRKAIPTVEDAAGNSEETRPPSLISVSDGGSAGGR